MSDITYDQMVGNLFKPDTLPMMYIHAGIGVLGESVELFAAYRPENIKEELGDWWFYFTKLCHLEQSDTSLFNQEADSTISLLIESHEILDCIKKFVIYGKALDGDKLHYHMQRASAAFRGCLEEVGIDLEDVKGFNMNKLLVGANARYKSGSFSTEQAIARADKMGEGQV